jgi:tRNA (cmo5U34)-methyltransferase
MRKKDILYAAKRARIDDFDFGAGTADVFDEMLSRSVPFYAEIQRMVVELAGDFIKEGTAVYDLGCSTGTTLAQLATTYPTSTVQLIGVDNSQPMLAHAREKLAGAGCLARSTLLAADVNDVAVENASAVLMILTLQFVRPLNRENVIGRLADGLNAGGALILVEKVLPDDPALNRLFIDHYLAFKRRQGYSELEIAQKREALENVLVPYRVEENLELLARAGFAPIDTFFRWYNFIGLVAIKSGTP